jgi:hypothetical protein
MGAPFSNLGFILNPHKQLKKIEWKGGAKRLNI